MLLLLGAAPSLTAIIPIFVFFGIVLGIWAVLSVISDRNSRMYSRLERHSRPASLAEIEEPRLGKKGERFQGLADMAKAMSEPLMPKTELEQSNLKMSLAHAGFRSESAVAVYSGLRLACLLVFTVLGAAIFLPSYGFARETMMPLLIRLGLMSIVGFYLPSVGLWWLRKKRQQAIFLTLPDCLDLLVVCVESGLGLDAAMRKVCEEMKGHATVLVEEISLANFQLQIGRPKREVLHDLGVRTGVDDVKSLAAILIQADRFGSSVAQALRVQSDSADPTEANRGREGREDSRANDFPAGFVHFPRHIRGAGGTGGIGHRQSDVEMIPSFRKGDTPMNGFRGHKLLAAGLVVGLATAAGCVCDDVVDPCYPERYEAMSRQEANAAFAPQMNNGHVLDQTVWNYDFQSGTDVLTAGGRDHLAYLARRRPAPDPVVYLQTAQDVAYDPAAPDRYMVDRNQLDARRVVAVQKYLAAIGGARGIPFEVKVHDPPQVGTEGVPVDLQLQKFNQATFVPLLVPLGAVGH
ncbi:MAG TPA: type II secretion system F family protein [Gemmataceae bacterium]|nr:type II secretion system F family protein [Gemmataceae bacterium]